jgi:hypothetical protein
LSGAGDFSLPSSLRSDPFLIWEEAEPDGERWWLARAHDEDNGDIRDFFIAEDDISGYLLGVVRPRRSGRFKVAAAVLLSDTISRNDAVATIKEQMTTWLVEPHAAATRRVVQQWRRRRSWNIAWGNFPLASTAYLIGALLGLIVALFAVSSGLVGWPMFVAGLLIGAGAGSVLKYIADRRPPALPGSWGRFVLVIVAAILGAATTAGGVLTLFWN